MSLPPSLDYSDKDYESLLARLTDLVQSVFPTWTDTAAANFGNILLQAHCFVGDMLSFYQDNQARECRFGSVQLRKNMISLCKLIGYELPGATAATADVTLTVSNPESLTGVVTATTTPVVIGTKSINPIKGEIQDSISIDLSSGVTTQTVTWEHSITQTPYIVASTGKKDQKYLLPFGPFLSGSENVDTATQGPWIQVDNFLNSGANDPHYMLIVDQNDRAEITFGDGQNGVIPVGNITFNYKTGGGTSGNVESNSLQKIEGTFVDSEGNTAYLTSTNANSAVGGTPREEVNAARVNAPESLRVLNRTVAREDYEINAKRVPEVGRALMLTSNEEPSVSENRGKLFIIPKTGGTASQSILDDVYEMVTVTYPNTTTFQVDVLPTDYKTVNVYVVVYLKNANQKTLAKTAINEALEDYFEPMLSDGTINENVDFGYNYKDQDGNPAGEVAWSDIFNVIRDVSYIRKIESDGLLLNNVADDVLINNWQFPALGTVTIINGYDGTEI